MARAADDSSIHGGYDSELPPALAAATEELSGRVMAAAGAGADASSPAAFPATTAASAGSYRALAAASSGAATRAVPTSILDTASSVGSSPDNSTYSWVDRPVYRSIGGAAVAPPAFPGTGGSGLLPPEVAAAPSKAPLGADVASTLASLGLTAFAGAAHSAAAVQTVPAPAKLARATQAYALSQVRVGTAKAITDALAVPRTAGGLLTPQPDTEVRQVDPVLEALAKVASAPECPGVGYPFARFSFWHLPVSAHGLPALVSAIYAALRAANVDATFVPGKCKFKCIGVVDNLPVTFRVFVYAGSENDREGAREGHSVEMQKRSGATLGWHALYARMVDALPQEYRPEALPGHGGSASPRRHLSPLPFPADFDDSSDSEHESEDAPHTEETENAATPLLRMAKSASINLRREAVAMLANMSTETENAKRFAADGTVAALGDLVAEAGAVAGNPGEEGRVADMVVAAAAAAAIANTVAQVATVTASLSADVRAAAPALLAVLERAAAASENASEKQLEARCARRESARALASIARCKDCAAVIEDIEGVGPLTRATMSHDVRLVGYAQDALGGVLGTVC